MKKMLFIVALMMMNAMDIFAGQCDDCSKAPNELSNCEVMLTKCAVMVYYDSTSWHPFDDLAVTIMSNLDCPGIKDSCSDDCDGDLTDQEFQDAADSAINNEKIFADYMLDPKRYNWCVPSNQTLVQEFNDIADELENALNMVPPNHDQIRFLQMQWACKAMQMLDYCNQGGYPDTLSWCPCE